MVGTIIPIGNGDTHVTEYKKRSSVIWVHVVGSISGAAIFGLAIGVTGMLLKGAIALPGHEQTLVLLIGVMALSYAGHEFKFFRLPAPQSGWQVPERWKSELPAGWSSFLYGVGLGPGLFTAIPSTTFYVVIAWVLVNASPWFGVFCFLIYGAGRAAPILLMFYLSEKKDAGELSRQASVWRPVIHILGGLALCVMGMSLIAGALSTLG